MVCDGRLVITTQDQKKEENFWTQHSQLARIGRFLGDMQLEGPTEMVSLRSLQPSEDLRVDDWALNIWQKAAQKGTAVSEMQYNGLLEGVPLTSRDSVLVVDLSPYVGCRALGLRRLVRKLGSVGKGSFFYHAFGIKGHPSAQCCAFSDARDALAAWQHSCSVQADK